VVEVEDAVGWLCSVDTAQEFDIFVVVGSWKVAVEAPVERSSAILGRELKESTGDIVATELDEGQVSVLESIGDDGVDGDLHWRRRWWDR
jgi:hypothetical protein